MYKKLKNRLTIILILLCFLVVSFISVTIIFALNQHYVGTDVGVEYNPYISIESFYFEQKEDGTYSIMGSSINPDYYGELVIPKTYNGQPVTTIGDNAFYGCTSLSSVVIPASVMSIGINAFSGCVLSSVNFNKTSGWFVSDSDEATSGTNLSSTDLSNTSTAATYLTSTYSNKYWKRAS